MNKKIKKLPIYIVGVLILTIGLSLSIFFTYRSIQYHKHPLPRVEGTLEWPEYLDGGCSDYDNAVGKNTNYAMNGNPPYVVRSIALKSLISEDYFWQKTKKILNEELSWVVGAYSTTGNLPGSPYILSMEISEDEWASLSDTSKYSLLKDIADLVKNEKTATEDRFYIYRCNDSGDAKWIAYSYIDQNGDPFIRFDWDKDTFEQIIDSINPF